MRPGRPFLPHSSSQLMAAAVVGNVTTSAGLRTRGTSYGLTTTEAPESFWAITYMFVTSPTASLSLMP